MPARRKPGLGLALLALSIAGPLQAQPPGAHGVISRCASKAGSTLTGIAALRKACPGIDEALGQLGLSSLLPPDWSQTLTTSGLTDLGTLLDRYSESPPSRPPGTASLRSIASALVPPSPPPTWAQRLESWIKHRTVPLLHRFGRWLRSLGVGAGHSGLARTMIYALAALVLAGALLLLFALRRAGLIHRRRSPTGPRHTAAGSMEPTAAPSGEPEWAQLGATPARILRLLVDALARSHRLGRERHLTCRELAAQARFDTDADREEFARVARLAERELYGPPATTLLPEETLRRLKLLHVRLLAAAGNGAASPS